MPTVTLPSVAAPALLAQSIAIRKAANEAWVAPTTTQGSDVTVTGTTYSATAAATLPVTAGDGLMAAVVTPGTVTTTTGVVSATGLTVGTVGKQADWASVSATNGVSAHLFVGLPSAGTATAPMVNTATVSVSGQSSGGTIFVRQPVIPKLETITDDFATQDTAKWTFAAAAAVTSGQVVCTPSTAWDAYFEAKAVYDLTGSSYVVELVQATATGTGGSLETYVELDSGGTHTNPMLLFRKVAGNLLSVWRNSSGTETTVNTAAYSATNHRWLRIRESGGTVFWEVSANGLSWNSYGSVATPFNITSLGVRQGCGTNTAEGSPGTAIFDNVNLPPTGTNYTASPADTAAASDGGLCGAGHGADGRRHGRWGGRGLAVQDMARTAADTAGAVDAVAVAQGRTVDDVGAATDAVVLQVGRAPADTAGATDSVAAVQDNARTLTDSAAASDAAAATQDVARTASDAAAVADNVTAQIGYARAAADTADATDSAQVIQSQSVTPADTAAATDTATLSRGVTAADTAGATDSAATVRTVTQAAADTADATDTAQTALGAQRTATDTAGATDAATAQQDQARTVTDTAGATDSVTWTLDVVRQADDVAAAADAVQPVQALQRAVADTAGAVDSVQVQGSGTVQRTVDDVAAATDSVAVVQDQARTLTDTAGATDAVTWTLDAVRQVTDTAGATDTATAQQVLQRTAVDAADATDAVQVEAAGSAERTVADTAGATDAVTYTMLREVTVADTAGVVDGGVEQTAARVYVVDDSAAAIDEVAVARTVVVVLADVAAVVDQADTVLTILGLAHIAWSYSAREGRTGGRVATATVRGAVRTGSTGGQARTSSTDGHLRTGGTGGGVEG
jgi:hypothetical protein